MENFQGRWSTMQKKMTFFSVQVLAVYSPLTTSPQKKNFVLLRRAAGLHLAFPL